jgi:putative oxidoreductase
MNYYSLASRSLIALLFVVAGIQKMMNFGDATTPNTEVNAIASLGFPAGIAALVTALVIIIEVPVALAFAWGYMTCLMGWILVAFTALTILLVHRDFTNGMNMIMALKNLAIIGGLMLAVHGCECGKCPIKVKGHSH